MLATPIIQQLNRLGQQREPFLFAFDYACQYPRIWTMSDLASEEVWFSFNGVGNAIHETVLDRPVWLNKFPMPFADYQVKFDRVMQAIRRGDSFLVNLSAPTPITTNLSLDEIYCGSRARYKFRLRNQFVCLSPEAFVQIEGNRMASFPMKGTRDAHLPGADARLLADPKEAAEHATIVDLIRNDVSQFAQKVWVERYRYLDRVTTNRGALWQASSEIVALLPNDWRDWIGTLLASMLPAGSISGAPKPSTLRIIHEVEQYDRGYYTGICGWFDGQQLDSGVMIRFVEQQADNQLVFKSGGGLTARSDAQSEYQELIDKIYFPLISGTATLPRNAANLAASAS